MVSVAEITRELVKSKPFLEDALIRGIINYNALAEELLPQVQERYTEGSVKLATISMALRRLGEQLSTQHIAQIQKKLGEFASSDMVIKYDLFEITVEISSAKDLGKTLSKLYQIVPITPNSFLSVTQGTSETTVITQSHYRHEIMELFNNFTLISKIDNLAALSLRIPETSAENPGLFYYITKTLAMDGINIVELISTFSEMQLILDEEDVAEASKTIRRLFKKVEVES
ncbi:MAG: hypothetical protein D6732_05625 [Methanobacteriota archaeon]|nr:MAG: hypothetical protein D6732_05625 [Euryarchaeota archaeon]